MSTQKHTLEAQVIEQELPAEDALSEEDLAPVGESTLVELMLAESIESGSEGDETEPPPELPSHIDGVLIGRLVAQSNAEQWLVTFPGAPPEGLSARVMTPLGPGDEDTEVALMFEGGDPHKPIVMGRMWKGTTAQRPAVSPARPIAHSDGERVELSADKELVLRCGKASITLTRAGKILIRGAYLLARSSGVNRIQGGSVQIN